MGGSRPFRAKSGGLGGISLSDQRLGNSAFSWALSFSCEIWRFPCVVATRLGAAGAIFTAQ